MAEMEQVSIFITRPDWSNLNLYTNEIKLELTLCNYIDITIQIQSQSESEEEV